MLLQNQGFESLFRGFESPEQDLNFAPWGIRIRNSKIRIALSDLQPSAFTFAKGFESITRRFESPSLVLQNSRYKDSNRCVGDSNPFFSSLFMFFMRDSNRWMGIRFGGSQHLFFLHMGFESLDWGFESVNLNFLTEIWIQISSWGIRITFVSLNFLKYGLESLYEGFESPSSVWTFWNVDSNRYMRDSNRLLRICLKNCRIERFFRDSNLTTRKQF